MAPISVTVGHGHEHDLQQTGRKHGEVDGAFEGHQVRTKICCFPSVIFDKHEVESSLSIIEGQRQKDDLCS